MKQDPTDDMVEVGQTSESPDEQPEMPAEQTQPALEAMAAGITADEPMVEAVRKVMQRQYQTMQANEDACRSGKSIDAIHDMRVATRRLRVAFRLFGHYFRRGAIRSFESDLRKTGRSLGATRDLDVLNKAARQYLRSLPKQQRKDLDPLLSSWKGRRQVAQRQLVDYLGSPRYRHFMKDLGEFLTTPGAGVNSQPADPTSRHQVRHVLGSTVWQLYEAVRAYEVVLPAAAPATLHALRIQCKYLRYILEFFQEVLGSGTPQLIQQVIEVQDHLGEIQDGEVASRMLSDFLATAYRQQAAATTPDFLALDGVTLYLGNRRDRAQQLMTTFPQTWKQIDGVKFRRRLSAAIVAL